MTKEDYEEGKKIIDESAEKQKKELAKAYAFANSTVKEGDIVTDHIGSVKVDVIRYTVPHRELPQCVYEGLVLKKDGTPTKKLERRQVWQCNLVK